jgi:ornithine cyclodeaminase/alanine dehydrogenase-like protein (mu-crystallin family)
MSGAVHAGSVLTGLPLIDGRRLRGLVPMTAAVVAIEAALADGSAPGATPARTSVLTGAGQVLLMPAATGRFVGVKLVTVAPDNGALGLPRVQGIYVLLDARSLTPIALVDGIALTSLRTPAVSAVAVRRLAPQRPVRLVVIGTGPQGYGHVEAVHAVRPITQVTVVGRDRARADAMAQWCANAGLDAAAVAGSDLPEDLEGPLRDHLALAAVRLLLAARRRHGGGSRQPRAGRPGGGQRAGLPRNGRGGVAGDGAARGR